MTKPRIYALSLSLSLSLSRSSLFRFLPRREAREDHCSITRHCPPPLDKWKEDAHLVRIYKVLTSHLFARTPLSALQTKPRREQGKQRSDRRSRDGLSPSRVALIALPIAIDDSSAFPIASETSRRYVGRRGKARHAGKPARGIG